jgi:hypothetical protein
LNFQASSGFGLECSLSSAIPVVAHHQAGNGANEIDDSENIGAGRRMTASLGEQTNREQKSTNLLGL